MRITSKLSWLTLLTLVLTLVIPQTINANSGQVYEVHSNILNVRSEPSSNSEVIGWLSKGDTVNTFQEQYGWVQTYYGGKTAWVAKHHLIAADQPAENNSGNTETQVASATSDSQEETITVAADGVHIRSGPSTAYKVIGYTNSGSSYPLLNTDGDWHQITLDNGQTGWIAAWLTDHATTANPETQTNTETIPSEPAAQETSQGALDGYTVVLDAGHGGKDPGAIGLGGIYEKDLVTSTANTVAQYLRQEGANVIETRSGDYYVSLDERVRISNANQTDAFISIHYNAYPVLSVQGTTSYYYGDSGRQLASTIQSSLASSTPLFDRGVSFGDYRVLRNSSAPAALLELGYITNSHDLNIVQTQDYQNTAAQAITNGLISYFN